MAAIRETPIPVAALVLIQFNTRKCSPPQAEHLGRPKPLEGTSLVTRPILKSILKKSG